MSDVFISYARSTSDRAQEVAEALRALGYGVWRDDDLPAHRAYAEVIEERLGAAKAVVVIWSAAAIKSEWVRSEADRARVERKLVQLRIDGARLPMPFDQIQCADLTGWSGDREDHGWRKVVDSIGELVGAGPASSTPAPATRPLPDKPSIAVMPFADMTGSVGQDYFADGMVAEITNALSRFKSIFVIASSSALTFKGKGVVAHDAARQLGVRYVLEGSIRKAADRVRIAVQLVDGADGAQLWTQRFDETLDDVFELQDKVALGVAGRIGGLLEKAELRRASARPTQSMDAHDLYLRALLLAQRFELSSDLKALDLLGAAIELDPDFGLALALAALCHAHLSAEQPREHRHRRQQALELAGRALGAAGDDAMVLTFAADAHGSLGGDPGFAIGLCERAVALNPGLSWAWFQSGWIRVRAGQSELGTEHLEISTRLDPISPLQAFRLAWLGIARFQQRQFADAVALLEESAHLLPSYPTNLPVLAAAFGRLGDIAAAQAALRRHRARSETPIDRFARWAFRDPGHRQLFLEGIAMAEERALDGERGALTRTDPT
ncbi:MAG TPA: TIR domain-containing protein [Caulobacteraceae bacterium]|nr:TIR domain-containing protein [Caulobacteraceae bacterium]